MRLTRVLDFAKSYNKVLADRYLYIHVKPKIREIFFPAGCSLLISMQQ